MTLSDPAKLYQKGTYKVRLYEKEDFKGQMLEFTEDCPHLHEKFQHHDVHSCNIPEGHWVFYEEPNYRGRQYYLRQGEYRRHTDWAAVTSKVDSFRRAIDSY
ncbi:hypothetical protein NDU88_003604 [Pleurodeles waltl]|uniref:Beta/gamma crystallin 'Greek key' domain-containing protein n=1 Tax=Pleurodeles waltl TaxID=8319 RepID=A0AAV7UEK0_PLEWA|nr:hypothetical protein NDU88_003604 [Pleurodeles waltl]